MKVLAKICSLVLAGLVSVYLAQRFIRWLYHKYEQRYYGVDFYDGYEDD